MFEFTKKSKKIIEVSAQAEGKRLNSDSLGPEHIFLSLLKDEDSVAARIMKNLGINFDNVIVIIERSLKPGGNTVADGRIPVNQSFRRVIEISRDEAKELKNSYIGTEHLLLSIFKERSCGSLSELEKGGITYDSVRDEILRVLGMKGGAKPANIKAEQKITPLEDFTVDLTAMAGQGLLDPVIGRDIEISQIGRASCRERVCSVV